MRHCGGSYLFFPEALLYFSDLRSLEGTYLYAYFIKSCYSVGHPHDKFSMPVTLYDLVGHVHRTYLKILHHTFLYLYSILAKSCLSTYGTGHLPYQQPRFKLFQTFDMTCNFRSPDCKSQAICCRHTYLSVCPCRTYCMLVSLSLHEQHIQQPVHFVFQDLYSFL